MDDLRAIRRVRLAWLRDTRFGGVAARLARSIEKSPAQLNQWLSGYRNLDERSARAIEDKLGLATGELSKELPDDVLSEPTLQLVELWRSEHPTHSDLSHLVYKMLPELRDHDSPSVLQRHLLFGPRDSQMLVLLSDIVDADIEFPKRDAAAIASRPSHVAQPDPPAYVTFAPPEAHEMSLPITQTPERILWEDLQKMAPLPTEFEIVLPDASMAPTAPMGSVVTFRRSSEARPAEAVLVRDKRGKIYFRECRAKADNGWVAFAYNPAFPTLDDGADGLEVLAQFVGIRIMWSQLPKSRGT